MRYELVQRGIEKADRNAESIHSFEDSFEVTALHGEQFCKSCATAFEVGSEDHFANCVDTVAFEEHVLCTAKADTLSAEFACLTGVAGGVGVGAYVCFCELVGKVHDSEEVAVECGLGGGHLTVVNFAG